MVSMPTVSVVDCGHDRWSGQTKGYDISICFSTKNVMVSMLTVSVVDCGRDRWSGQTKGYDISICFSTKNTALRGKVQRLVGSESG